MSSSWENTSQEKPEPIGDEIEGVDGVSEGI